MNFIVNSETLDKIYLRVLNRLSDDNGKDTYINKNILDVYEAISTSSERKEIFYRVFNTNQNVTIKPLHFVYGYKQAEYFTIENFVAVMSANIHIRPSLVVVHYEHEPYGKFWDYLVENDIIVKHPHTAPNKIYDKQLHHFAHKSDITRLQVLYKYGGIYLDMDTITFKSFDNLIHKKKFIMAQQHPWEYGLCNAVMISPKHSPFCKVFLESYKSFNGGEQKDENWDFHSVRNIKTLAKTYSQYIEVLQHEKFFKYDWNNIDIFFSEYPDITNSYCLHLWDQNTKNIKKGGLYSLLSRKYITCMNDKVSIVMLTFNRVERNKIVLNSYLKLLYRNDIFELLICDNNSTDETIEFLKQFEMINAKIRVVYKKKNLGVAGGRKFLFEEAKGDIIMSVDSDLFIINPHIIDVVKYNLQPHVGILGIHGVNMKSYKWNDFEEVNLSNSYCDLVTGCCQIFR